MQQPRSLGLLFRVVDGFLSVSFPPATALTALSAQARTGIQDAAAVVDRHDLFWALPSMN